MSTVRGLPSDLLHAYVRLSTRPRRSVSSDWQEYPLHLLVLKGTNDHVLPHPGLTRRSRDRITCKILLFSVDDSSPVQLSHVIPHTALSSWETVSAHVLDLHLSEGQPSHFRLYFHPFEYFETSRLADLLSCFSSIQADLELVGSGKKRRRRHQRDSDDSDESEEESEGETSDSDSDDDGGVPVTVHGSGKSGVDTEQQFWEESARHEAEAEMDMENPRTRLRVFGHGSLAHRGGSSKSSGSLSSVAEGGGATSSTISSRTFSKGSSSRGVSSLSFFRASASSLGRASRSLVKSVSHYSRSVSFHVGKEREDLFVRPIDRWTAENFVAWLKCVLFQFDGSKEMEYDEMSSRCVRPVWSLYEELGRVGVLTTLVEFVKERQSEFGVVKLREIVARHFGSVDEETEVSEADIAVLSGCVDSEKAQPGLKRLGHSLLILDANMRRFSPEMFVLQRKFLEKNLRVKGPNSEEEEGEESESEEEEGETYDYEIRFPDLRQLEYRLRTSLRHMWQPEELKFHLMHLFLTNSTIQSAVASEEKTFIDACGSSSSPQAILTLLRSTNDRLGYALDVVSFRVWLEIEKAKAQSREDPHLPRMPLPDLVAKRDDLNSRVQRCVVRSRKATTADSMRRLRQRVKSLQKRLSEVRRDIRALRRAEASQKFLSSIAEIESAMETVREQQQLQQQQHESDQRTVGSLTKPEMKKFGLRLSDETMEICRRLEEKFYALGTRSRNLEDLVMKAFSEVTAGLRTDPVLLRKCLNLPARAIFVLPTKLYRAALEDELEEEDEEDGSPSADVAAGLGLRTVGTSCLGCPPGKGILRMALGLGRTRLYWNDAGFVEVGTCGEDPELTEVMAIPIARRVRMSKVDIGALQGFAERLTSFLVEWNLHFGNVVAFDNIFERKTCLDFVKECHRHILGEPSKLPLFDVVDAGSRSEANAQHPMLKRMHVHDGKILALEDLIDLYRLQPRRPTVRRMKAKYRSSPIMFSSHGELDEFGHNVPTHVYDGYLADWSHLQSFDLGFWLRHQFDARRSDCDPSGDGCPFHEVDAAGHIVRVSTRE